MKMTTYLNCRALTCDLIREKDLTVRLDVPDTGYLPETVVYAVCRFLCASRKLCRAFVPASYAMRLEKGRKAVRHTLVIPAPLAGLPAGWLRVGLTVRADGVHIHRVNLSRAYPG